MNYLKLYHRLIVSRKVCPHPTTSVTEKHHIVPRSFGGDNSKANLVRLTPKEHFIAHLLLVKIFQNKDGPEYRKMLYAFNLMGGARSYGSKITSKLYQRLKEDFIKTRREDSRGSKNQNFGKSWFYNPQTKECKPFYPDQAPDGFIKGRNPERQASSRNAEYRKRKCKNCGEPLNLQKPSPQKLCAECRKLANAANLGKLAKPKISDERIIQIHQEFLKFRESRSGDKIGVFRFADRYKGEVSLDTLYKRWRKLNLSY